MRISKRRVKCVKFKVMCLWFVPAHLHAIFLLSPPGPSPFGPSPFGPSHLALETEHLTAVACGQTHTLVASGECLVVATWMDGRRDEWYLGGSGDGG